MRKPVFVLALGLLLGTSVLTARGQDPRTPSYLILRAPAQVPHGQPHYPGRGYAVKPQAYAYGWFGASRAAIGAARPDTTRPISSGRSSDG